MSGSMCEGLPLLLLLNIKSVHYGRFAKELIVVLIPVKWHKLLFNKLNIVDCAAAFVQDVDFDDAIQNLHSSTYAPVISCSVYPKWGRGQGSLNRQNMLEGSSR